MGTVIVIFISVCVLYVLSMTSHMMGLIIDTSVLIALICLIRALFRRHIHAGVMYSLWGLVALRFFATPLLSLIGQRFYFQGVFEMGAVNPLNSGVDAICRWLAPNQVQVASGNTQALSGSAQAIGNTPARVDLLAVSLPAWFWIVWIAGVLFVYLWSVYVNEKFRRQLFDERIRVSVPECRYPVYKVPDIISPCVMRVNGKVGIYLTEAVAEDDEKREYALAHEICHLRHRDLFWGNIRCIILACNWFNPLIWLAAVLSKRDEELACDERVIRVLGEAKRFRYGKVLVDVVADTALGKNFFITATTMGCKKRELVQRIWKIADGEKHILFSSVVFALAIATAFMTSFVARADMRGLSPEETVQQYSYYCKQNYKEGMAGLEVDSSQYWRKSGIALRKCGNTDVEDGYYIDIDEAEKIAERNFAETCWLKGEEEFLLVKETKEADWKILRTGYLAGFSDLY